jgi:hypothetical protein
VEHLLAHGDRVAFPPFDRFAPMPGQSLDQLLDAFRDARAESLRRLEELVPAGADLRRTGRHPEFGVVTLAQHLATWTAHDLDHLAQIARVMGRQYASAVGPWRQYLRIMPDARTA